MRCGIKQLHGTVGPAATTIMGIAEQAQVTRLTVYRHFPDDEKLFAACSAHWLSQQTLPDPDSWSQIADPIERLRGGLTDLYRFYRAGESMLSWVYHDKESLPARNRDLLERRDVHFRDVLLKPFAVAGAPRRRLRAVLATLFPSGPGDRCVSSTACRTVRQSTPWPR